MSIFENFKTAIFSILSNKMRTILTTLGIIIGITSVTTITAIGQGFENQINDTFASMNTDTVTVSNTIGETINQSDKFKPSDIPLLKEIENIEYSAPVYNANMNVHLKNPNETDGVTVHGSSDDTQKMQKVVLEDGRFIGSNDNEHKVKVAVIDETLAKKIFGRTNVVGDTIKLSRINNTTQELELEVVGVSEGISDSLATSTIYVPINTLMDFFGATEDIYNEIYIKLYDVDLFTKTSEEVKKVLSASHNTSTKKYDVAANFQIMDMMQGAIQIFTIFVGLVAGISLLVGGIGIMNIMLVTVTERTKEIGIRKSLGATNSNIQTQFLIEAIAVSLFGGGLGVICGYIFSFISGKVLEAFGNTLVPEVSTVVVFGSLGISAFIGVVFGVYPAYKAAKLDPIEALRFE